MINEAKYSVIPDMEKCSFETKLQGTRVSFVLFTLISA